MWSEECEVWNEKWEMWNEKWEVRSEKWGMRNVERSKSVPFPLPALCLYPVACDPTPPKICSYVLMSKNSSFSHPFSPIEEFFPLIWYECRVIAGNEKTWQWPLKKCHYISRNESLPEKTQGFWGLVIALITSSLCKIRRVEVNFFLVKAALLHRKRAALTR